MVSDGNGASCTTPTLSGSGTTYVGSCTIDAESEDAQVTATYDAKGTDQNYHEGSSNSLDVGSHSRVPAR